MQRRAAAVILFVLASGLAGCSAAPPGSVPVTATVHVHSGTVAVKTPGGDAVSGADGARVAAGDVVAVSGDDAVVELTWTDGAVTRLGPGTTFEVGDPGTALGERGTQTGGVSWNRVPAASAPAATGAPSATPSATSGAASAAPYAVAVTGADRVQDAGALFFIDCRATPCRILRTGGNPDDGADTTFRRGTIDTVVSSGTPTGWAALMSDPWAQQNAALDEAAGLTPVAELFVGADPSRGLLDGTFDVARTFTTWDCTGTGCAILARHKPGDRRDLVYTFHSACDAEATCSPTVDTQTISFQDDSVSDSTVPLIAGASRFTWGLDTDGYVCGYPDGPTWGKTQNAVRWTVTPSKAEVRDGVFVVTELTGTASATFDTTQSAGRADCRQYEYDLSTTSELTLTKREG